MAELYSPIEVYISEALRTVSTLKLKGSVPIGRAWKLRNIDLDCLGYCWGTMRIVARITGTENLNSQCAIARSLRCSI